MSAAAKLGVKEGLVLLAGLGAVAAVPVVVMSSADVQQRQSLPAHENAPWKQQQPTALQALLDGLLLRPKDSGLGSENEPASKQQLLPAAARGLGPLPPGTCTGTGSALRPEPAQRPAAACAPNSAPTPPQPTASPPSTRSHSVAELAALHSEEMATLRSAAASLRGGRPLPSGRFPDTELLRFAATHGFLRAGASEAQRATALARGAAAAARTADWLASQPLPPAREGAEPDETHCELLRWSPPDAAGRPTLHVALGRAATELRAPGAAQRFADSIVAQMEAAVSGPCPPEAVVVEIDAAGATALSASRVGWVLRGVALALNQHYPGRLHELQLLHLPGVLMWAVHGVRQLVHPDTRHKVRVVVGEKEEASLSGGA